MTQVKPNNIQDSFNHSLTSPVLNDAIIDVAELPIDNLLNNELIKSLPIVKTIAGLVQTGANIQDKLFLKKILSFLQNIDQVPAKERKKVISNIDNSGKYSVKVGEKLLYILDSCDDHTHAENIAKLFSAMLKGRITYGQYADAAQIIARISKDELEQFLDAYTGIGYLDDSASSLGHTGLVYSETTEIDVEIEKVEQASWKDTPEHYEAKTNGGYTITYSTRAGDTVSEVFDIGKEKLEQQTRERREKEKVKLQGATLGSWSEKK